MAIAEFFFNLIGQMAGTHHQATETLRSQLQNQQLKEGHVPNRRQWFRPGRQCRSQARPESADEKNSAHIPSSGVL